jgi:uncharacterized protein DUF6308
MTQGLGPTLHRFLEHEAADLVSEYFGTGDGGDLLFTGSRFDALASGGDALERRNHFDATDIVAVSMLSVTVSPRAALALIEDCDRTFSALLADVPANVDLWDADEAVIGPGSPADVLWHAIKSLPDVGYVTAGKLCARKRPKLLPVYDDIVRRSLGTPEHFWVELRAALREDASLVTRLHWIRDAVGCRVSLLRVLDIAIWMRNCGYAHAANPTLTQLQPIWP